MQPVNITILTFGSIGKEFLDKVADTVRREFNCMVVIREVHQDLGEFYDSGRRQYNGDKLLRMTCLHAPEETGKVMALFNFDIFIPILTYIFGQAHLGGNCGIMSLYRLNNERYGLAADETLLLDRTCKEVIHELGHTFGLMHCIDTDCVMHASTYVEDIDLKGRRLCQRCRTVAGLE